MNFADVIDEAAERGGLDPAALESRHLESIRRSMHLLNIELETEGAQAEFREQTTTIPIVSGAGSFSLPQDTIDVHALQITDTSSGEAGRITLSRENRISWASLADPGDTGQPTVYFISKANPRELEILQTHNDVVKHIGTSSSFGGGSFGDGTFGGTSIASISEDEMRELVPTGMPIAVLWPIADRAYNIQVSYTRFHAEPETFDDEIDAARNWLPTIVAGLASKIAQKYALDRYALLQAEYQSLLLQRSSEQNMNPVFIGWRGYGFSRRRRH